MSNATATSSNPVFSKKAIARFAGVEGADKMTVSGSLTKTAFAMIVLFAAAVAGWFIFPKIGDSIPWFAAIAFMIATPIVGIVTAFKANPFTVTLYAILEGTLIGIASKAFETTYDGIVLQAVLFTLATTLGMLVLYSTGIIKVTQKMRSIILIATAGVFLYFIFAIIMSFVSPGFVTVLASGPVGIAIAAVIVLIAALNLLLDFDFLSRGSEQGLDKKAEWYAAFGLLVTIVWLYLSILRLLAASKR